MKENIVYKLLHSKAIVVPSVLLEYQNELKADAEELLFLAFLMEQDDLVLFDIASFSKNFYRKKEKMMELISKLCDKDLLRMEVKKKGNVMREYLDLTPFYEKLTLLCIKENKTDDITIYQRIEKEFGRTLSPIECEMIKGWIDAPIDQKMILEALKETVLNGVTNLKYMDKILMEWSKKGISKRKMPPKELEKVEYFDYDWLSEDERE